jgi:putative tryptophan/tyrosine transport system substrate-binding protein
MKRRTFIAGLGTAAAWPAMARGQQSTIPVIGYLSSATESSMGRLNDAFHQGLSEQGFVDGQNVKITSRYAETQYDRMPALAADLVRAGIALIVVMPNVGNVRAAMAATTRIPIVFALGGDPVEAGLVASLNHPSANVTGAFYFAVPLIAKRLQLLHQIVPAATSIGYLANSRNPQLEVETREAESAARALGVRLVAVKVSTSSELETAFAFLVDQRVDALLIGADSLFWVERTQMAALAARYAIPTIYYAREFVDAGGLVSYSGDVLGAWRTAGVYAGRILRGAKPADLPVQQSTRLELAVNLRAAKGLGLKIPTSILAIADEVIE